MHLSLLVTFFTQLSTSLDFLDGATYQIARTLATFKDCTCPFSSVYTQIRGILYKSYRSFFMYLYFLSLISLEMVSTLVSLTHLFFRPFGYSEILNGFVYFWLRSR